MSSLKFWIKVTRPVQCLLAACATWVIALLSNGPLWFTTEKIAGGGVIFLMVLGSSVYHYGAAHKMYARKSWDLVEVQHPELLVLLGYRCFMWAIAIAALFLPLSCMVITVISAIAIMCYAQFLSKHWATKNVVIAFVCTTPILIGWLSGHRMHPAIPYFVGFTFFGYWAREIIKDLQDIKANHGIRVTLPMWIGPQRAMLLALCFTVCGIGCLAKISSIFLQAPMLVLLSYLAAIGIFAYVAYLLAKNSHVMQLPSLITLGNACLLLSAFGLRLARY